MRPEMRPERHSEQLPDAKAPGKFKQQQCAGAEAHCASSYVMMERHMLYTIYIEYHILNTIYHILYEIYYSNCLI